ncbi:hypothetical protein GFH30_00995 [Acinetobacter wanghuae]|uniref:Secreted protein n=1 Tax=Acinetobacter wanghuae TaxID=2662362 RepID=A0ABX6D2R6_9GAMM|nr:hypothetical protein [Acinetobacter wanghuae]QGA10061.1 hypothetical protein GFH30_00995 [Acinetobacter wanghuae]
MKFIFWLCLLKSILFGYIEFVRCKIIESALVGCKSNIGAQSALRAFFVRKISMRSHVMAELERDTSMMCAGSLCYLPTNPFQLRHPNHLVVIDEAPKYIGAHSS